MPYSTIDKPSSYFNTVLYTGNGSTQSITGVGFKPDWVWTKSRSTSGYHRVYDIIRGTSLALFPNDAGAEATNSGVTSFDSNGFTMGSINNDNGTTYSSWNWLANGTGASNTSGTITSTVSANTTSGFSVVTWSGSGTNDQTIGHGLGVAPSFIIHKNRTYGSGDATGHWIVKTKEKINSSGSGSILYLNQTNAYSDNVHGTLIPSGSTLLQVKGGSGSPSDFWVNASGSNYVAYCFAEIKGYSKFGSYTGNGNADGTFVYTGFKPAFIMIKSSSSAVGNWLIQNNKMQGFNKNNDELYANLSDSAYVGTDRTDLLSNGFKTRINSNENNASGVTYIYMAFAESPFVSSKSIPTTAR